MSAPIQLSEAGKSLIQGDNIQYIYTHAHHKNPLCRVMPQELFRHEKELNYDKEKYREMLLEVSEMVLGYFGFDKTVYCGEIRKNRNRKWWHELREERIRDIGIERT